MAGTEDRGNVVETALCNLAALAMDRGALDEAQDALRRCVATHTEGEMSRTIIVALGNLGAVQHALGQTEAAMESLRRTEAHARRAG